MSSSSYTPCHQFIDECDDNRRARKLVGLTLEIIQNSESGSVDVSSLEDNEAFNNLVQWFANRGVFFDEKGR